MVVLSYYANLWLLSNSGLTRQSFFAYTALELSDQKAYWNCNP